LRALRFEARGRRAIDETLADWKHEDDRSGTLARRLWRSVCGCASLFRVLAGLTVQETVTMPIGWLMGRLTLFVLAPSILLVLPAVRAVALSGPHALFILTPLLLPQVVVVMLPLGFFFSVAWPPRGRPIPVLGVMLCSFVLALITTNWAVPSGSQAYREMSFALFGGSGTLARGNLELSLLELAYRAYNEGWDGPVSAHLFLRTGLVVLCPAMVLLMIGLSRLSRRQQWIWFGAVPIVFILCPLAVDFVGMRIWYRDPGGWGFWLLALLSVATALKLNWRSAESSACAQPSSGT
jgi:hypothetical protein